MKTITLLVGASCFVAGVALCVLATAPVWAPPRTKAHAAIDHGWHRAISWLAFHGWFPPEFSQRSTHA